MDGMKQIIDYFQALKKDKPLDNLLYRTGSAAQGSVMT